MKFFRKKVHDLSIDERHYFATCLHLKDQDMSKFARITFFSNGRVNTFLYFELIQLLFADKKITNLSRLHSIFNNVKPISSTNDIIDSFNDEQQRKSFKLLHDDIADFQDDTCDYSCFCRKDRRN